MIYGRTGKFHTLDEYGLSVSTKGVIKMGENKKPDFQVTTPIKTGDKTFWQIIGAAWKKDDGNISIKLNALPLGDSLFLGKPKDDK